MGKPMSASLRQQLTEAMDAPMTDDEAIGLIAEMVLLTSGLLKAASPRDQEVMAPKVVRCGHLVEYVREAFRDRDTYHRIAMDKMVALDSLGATTPNQAGGGNG